MLVCAALSAIAATTDGLTLAWWLGVGFGAIGASYGTFRELPPHHIDHWRTGAEGERRTARVLAPLRKRGHLLLHDLLDRQSTSYPNPSNIDHVVISPAGVFLLDTKWLGGDASVQGDVVRVQMLDDEDDEYEFTHLARCMRGRALRLQQDIARATGVTNVQAVVVFWNGFPDGLVEENRVVYVAGDRLVSWLEAQPATIGAAAVPSVASAVEDVRPTGDRAWWRQWRPFEPRTRAARTSSVVQS